MKKVLLGLAIGLSIAGAVAALAAPTSLPYPSINGPSIGDPLSNLYTMVDAYGHGTGLFSKNGISVSQSSGQSNCTQLGSDELQQLATSASTGYVCLPTAAAGKLVMISNATGQSIDIYSSATSAVAGTADKINGTAGTSAYTGLTSSEAMTVCQAPKAGLWYCMSGT